MILLWDLLKSSLFLFIFRFSFNLLVNHINITVIVNDTPSLEVQIVCIRSHTVIEVSSAVFTLIQQMTEK